MDHEDDSEPSAKSTYVGLDLRQEILDSQSSPPEDDLQSARYSLTHAATTIQLQLRCHPTPPLPDEPFPFRAPYTHPALLGGRGQELRNLCHLLRLPVPVLGLHAIEGVGKTSLLAAGLVPTLRAAGHPVAMVRFPTSRGLAELFVDELLDSSRPNDIALQDAHEPGAFVDLLLTARRLGGKPVILVLDQLEYLMGADGEEGRAILGELLLISIREKPEGLPVRWLFSYREDAHDAVRDWLSGLDQELMNRGSHFMALPVLGSLPASDALYEAERAFRSVLEAPFSQTSADGEPVYPYRFDPEAMSSLAQAFAAERVAAPTAPLVPELQSVLEHLLEMARDLNPTPGTPARVKVDDIFRPRTGEFRVDPALAPDTGRLTRPC
jgi:hypothetical protein